MVRKFFIASLAMLSIISFCSFAVADDATKTETAKTADLPSFTYPDIPKYYPNIDASDRIELLAEAKDIAEIMTWADKNKAASICGYLFLGEEVGASVEVFQKYSGKYVTLHYEHLSIEHTGKHTNIDGRLGLTDPKPMKLRYVGLAECIKQPYSLIFDPNPIRPNSIPSLPNKDTFRDHRFPNLPEKYVGDIGEKKLLISAKNKQDILTWQKQSWLTSFVQLEAPFDRLFVVLMLSDISSSQACVGYEMFLYGKLGNNSTTWNLLYCGGAIPNRYVNRDTSPLQSVYIDKKTHSIVFGAKDGTVIGQVNIENELKLIYGDQYDAVMKEAESK